MDHDFFVRFYPRILDVYLLGGRERWEQTDFEIYRESTSVHNLIYVLNGEGELTRDGVLYPVLSHCLFHHRPGMSFRLISDRGKPLEYYAVHYDYAMLKWEGGTVQASGPEGGLPFDAVVWPNDFNAVQLLYDELYQMWGSKQGGYVWKSRLLFLELLREIDKQQTQQAVVKESEALRLIDASLEYIKGHFTEALQREQLAEKASLSLSYYSLLFRKRVGFTPMQFIHRLRLDYAKQLLRSTKEPISDIAREVGYEDPLYFSKLFSKELGMSPREYRKA